MHFEELLTPTWPRDRVVVGRRNGQFVALDEGQPLLVVGPPRAGKTTAICVPNVARWRGNVVATSIRADVLDVTYAQRAARGEVRVFDPTATLGYPLPGHFDFVAPCVDFDIARTTARTMLQYSDFDSVRDGEFWRSTAARLLGVLLFAGAHSRRRLDAVTDWLTASESLEVLQVLEQADNPSALRVYEDFTSRNADTFFGSVRATALAAMQTYEDSRVAQRVQAGGLDPDRFLAGPANSLFLCLAPEEQRLLAPYSALVVDQIVAAQHRRARFRDPGEAPLLLALDEAMNIAPLRDLAVLASTAAGTGIQLITIAHDFSQIMARYGEAGAHTIVANHSLLLLGGGLREHALGTLLDRLVDPHQIPGGSDWHGTPSEWVRRLDARQGLLIHRDLAPEVIDVTRWFDDDAQVVEHLDALYSLGAVVEQTVEETVEQTVEFGFEPTDDDPAADPTPPPDAPPSAPPRPASDWSRFECGPTGVSAQFPASPNYERESPDHGGTRHRLCHEEDDWSVSLHVTEMEYPPPADAAMGPTLERAAAGLAHELNADVLALEPLRIGDYDALDVDLVGHGHHTHVRLTSTETCLVAARMRARAPARERFNQFVSTVEISATDTGPRRMSQLRLDRSGRLTVPAWLRRRLPDHLVISRWYHHIRVWSVAAFDAQVIAFHAEAEQSAASRRGMRGFLASSAPTRLDHRGRLLVPERFRQGCGIGLMVELHPTDDGFEFGPLR